MSRIVVYVQDVNQGVPAHGVMVELQRLECDRNWHFVARGVTQKDGCIEDLTPESEILKPGSYRLVFDTGPYFERQEINPLFHSAGVEFSISSDAEYVLPLLLSPHSYTIYRGS